MRTKDTAELLRRTHLWPQPVLYLRRGTMIATTTGPDPRGRVRITTPTGITRLYRTIDALVAAGWHVV